MVLRGLLLSRITAYLLFRANFASPGGFLPSVGCGAPAPSIGVDWGPIDVIRQSTDDLQSPSYFGHRKEPLRGDYAARRPVYRIFILRAWEED